MTRLVALAGLFSSLLIFTSCGESGSAGTDGAVGAGGNDSGDPAATTTVGRELARQDAWHCECTVAGSDVPVDSCLDGREQQFADERQATEDCAAAVLAQAESSAAARNCRALAEATVTACLQEAGCDAFDAEGECSEARWPLECEGLQYGLQNELELCSGEREFDMAECADGTPLPEQFLCDLVEQCADGSDESPLFAGCDVQCGDGESVPASSYCDGPADCTTGADEQDCEGRFQCVKELDSIEDVYRCNYRKDCDDGSDETGCPNFQCDNGETILPDQVCDGHAHCSDGSDEAEFCETTFECRWGFGTVGFEQVCDGFPACGDASDEARDHCDDFVCDPFGSTEAIAATGVCDGVAQCSNGRDELNCPCQTDSDCPSPLGCSGAQCDKVYCKNGAEFGWSGTLYPTVPPGGGLPFCAGDDRCSDGTTLDSPFGIPCGG